MLADGQNTVLTSAPVALTVTGGTAASAAVYYIHTDQLNTPRVIADQSQAVVWKWESDGFGSTPPNEQPGTAPAFEFNPRFAGQYFDRESNLHYNYYRDYDPQTGRYVQSDPIGLEGGINTYSYVSGNPVGLTDPSGLDPWYREPAVRKREAIARDARKHNGSKNWSIGSSHSDTRVISSRPFGIGQFKCNLFLNDVLKESGKSPGLMPNGLPPVASDWYEGRVPGFYEIPANLVSNGDVAVKVYPGQSGYTGHVGIVVSALDRTTASQSSKVNHVIVNDWGFDAATKYYRCECAN